MSDYDPPIGAHDRYLANYHTGTTWVWCSNPTCENHADGLEIDTETEYGQTTWTPEECPRCHADWLDSQPEDDEEE